MVVSLLLRKKKRNWVKRTGDIGYATVMVTDLLGHRNDIDRNMDAVEKHRNSRNPEQAIPEQAIFRSL